uniref:CoB--CoM heterodisulfide reductase iron-sulfur subunit A family protein n=1 Tax=Thermodesulfobium narugense TaxID=184064 RepID=A0A7C5P7Y3_9BACT
MIEFQGKVLVIGGGISGITAAIEAAETGVGVYLVEKNPYLGGRVAQLTKYFPKLCPPTCGLELNFRRMRENKGVEIMTQTEVLKVDGTKGNFKVTLKKAPRFVNENCTLCGECFKVCPVERDDEFNFNMKKTKAIYSPFEFANPPYAVIDPNTCLGEKCSKCLDACKYGAIDLKMKEEIIDITVDSIIVTTGWQPYDAGKIDNLKFGIVPNVITNMMMERLASPSGPTGGKILRPSDNKPVKNVAFVQCAGSRDENHLPYCSYICCMASLKQCTYLVDQDPEAKATVYYIDIRTPGRYEQFYWNVKENQNINFVKGKVANIEADPSGDVWVEAEDILAGSKSKERFDMVVLATGMQPASVNWELPFNAKKTPEGFIDPDSLPDGIYLAGSAVMPFDVIRSLHSATGSVLKALQSISGRGN